jgi:peptidoglycan/LPS O-acetylase OafA/YrhL
MVIAIVTISSATESFTGSYLFRFVFENFLFIRQYIRVYHQFQILAECNYTWTLNILMHETE